MAVTLPKFDKYNTKIRPPKCDIQVDNIPQALKDMDRWVCWSYQLNTDKKAWTKPPVHPSCPNKAVGCDRVKMPFLAALEHYKTNDEISGIGFVLGDGVSAIDFDHCYDGQRFSDEASTVLNELQSYTEFGPSGDGFHTFVFGDFKFSEKKKKYLLAGNEQIELFREGMYVTITGELLNDELTDLQQRDEQLASIYERHEARKREVDDTSSKDASREDLKFAYGLCEDVGADEGKVLAALLSSDRHRPKFDEVHTADGKTYAEMLAAKAVSRYQENQSKHKIYTDPNDFNFSDTGNAKRFLKLYGDVVRYCRDIDKWLAWNEKRWREEGHSAESVIEYYVMQTAKHYQQEARSVENARMQHEKLNWAIKMEDRRNIANCIANASKIPKVSVGQDELDANPYLVNLQNGTFDLKHGELLEHKKDDLLTKMADVVYDPVANAPKWSQFLHEVFCGDEDLIRYVQCAVGYSVCGTAQIHHLVFFLYGEGENGKSTFCEIIGRILGEYTDNLPNKFFELKKHDRHENEYQILKGKRFIYGSEVSRGAMLDEAKLNYLTGGERIKARGMYRDYETAFEPSHHIFLSLNHLPKTKSKEKAIWRRIRVLPFEYQVKTVNYELKSQLLAERAGIFNWMLDGWRQYHTTGMPESAAVKHATDSYKRRSDPIHCFMDECLVADANHRLGGSDIYGLYENWACENDEVPETMTRLGTRLKKVFQHTRTKFGSQYYVSEKA